MSRLHLTFHNRIPSSTSTATTILAATACSGSPSSFPRKHMPFPFRVFAVAAVLGVGVLLPVNFLGDQLREIDIADLPNKSIELFSVSNVQDGSNK